MLHPHFRWESPDPGPSLVRPPLNETSICRTVPASRSCECQSSRRDPGHAYLSIWASCATWRIANPPNSQSRLHRHYVLAESIIVDHPWFWLFSSNRQASPCSRQRQPSTMETHTPVKECRTPSLPQEILLLIMAQVEHNHKGISTKTALVEASLVCKEWAKAANEVFWRRTPATMMTLVPASRRQYCAKMVVDLSFNAGKENKLHSQFNPRLKSLSIRDAKLRKNQKFWLGQYFQRSLESFHWSGGHDCGDMFTQLEIDCPRLRELFMEDPFGSTDITPDRLIEFFQRCLSLASVTLGEGFDYLMSAGVLAQLAGLEKLVKLSFHYMLPNSLIQKGLRQGPTNAFQNLRSLGITLQSQSVPAMVSAVKSIHTLVLRLEDSESDVLAALEPLTGLVHLQVKYRCYTASLSQKGIDSLSEFTKLELLLICSWFDLEAPWLDDEKFASLTSNLPNLCELTFRATCSITLSSLTALSVSHPALFCCDLVGIFCLDDWVALSGPLFSKMRSFAVGAPYIQGRVRGSVACGITSVPWPN